MNDPLSLTKKSGLQKQVKIQKRNKSKEMRKAMSKQDEKRIVDKKAKRLNVQAKLREQDYNFTEGDI